MTVQVRIEHTNETVPKNLMVVTRHQDGTVLSTTFIGPGGQRMVQIGDGMTVEVAESEIEYREDGDE